MFLSHSNKVAINCGTQHIHYDELHSRVKFASQQYKVDKDDRVVIFSENRVGWIYTFYSIWLNRATVVPIDFMSTATDVAHILSDCKPKIIIVSSALQKVLSEAMIKSGISAQVIDIEKFEAEVDSLKFEEKVVINPDIKDRAVIVYTSGTTGKPKGVMLSYENLWVNVKAVSIDIEILTGKQNILILLPLHHILPMLGSMIAPFISGGTVSISPTMATDDIIRTLQDNGVTVIIGVPRLYTAIHKGIIDKIKASKVASLLYKVAKRINSPAFSKFIFGKVHKKFGGKVRFMVCGGAAVDPKVASDFVTFGFDFLEGYGMTEAAPMITFTRPGKLKIGSPGQIVSHAEVTSFDGELVVKGANVMMGYYGMPDETAEVIKDGWLYTGDLGYVKDDGYLYLTGRKKELIILSNGKNIQPIEVEEKILFMSDAIAEVGVFQKDDHLHAIISVNKVLFEGQDKNQIEESIRKIVLTAYNKDVPSYKKVVHFTLIDGELPRTRLGKIKRHMLEQMVVDSDGLKDDAKVQISSDWIEELRILVEYLSTEKRCNVSPNDHIEFDLGLDSLDKVGFQSFIEATFGLKMESDRLVAFENVNQLSIYINEHRSKMKVTHFDWTKIIKERVNIKFPRTWITSAIIVKLSKWFFQIYFRFRSKGLENLPDGPCIIAPNHQSFFDGLFVTAFLRSKQVRKTYFYAKEQHVRGGFMRFFAKRNNVIVMDMNKDLKESIQKMAEVLRNKKYLVIFPEGTRSKSGKIGDFKKTFAILSSELNVPVVPVSIRGAIDALPSGSIFPMPFKKICVEFLKPVYPESSTYDGISDQVRNQILSHQNKSCNFI